MGPIPDPKTPIFFLYITPDIPPYGGRYVTTNYFEIHFKLPFKAYKPHGATIHGKALVVTNIMQSTEVSRRADTDDGGKEQPKI